MVDWLWLGYLAPAAVLAGCSRSSSDQVRLSVSPPQVTATKEAVFLVTVSSDAVPSIEWGGLFELMELPALSDERRWQLTLRPHKAKVRSSLVKVRVGDVMASAEVTLSAPLRAIDGGPGSLVASGEVGSFVRRRVTFDATAFASVLAGPVRVAWQHDGKPAQFPYEITVSVAEGVVAFELSGTIDRMGDGRGTFRVETPYGPHELLVAVVGL